jgi:hypothetical protein
MARRATNEPSWIISATNLAGAVASSGTQSETTRMNEGQGGDSLETILSEYRSRIEREPNLLLPYQEFITKQKHDYEQVDKRQAAQLAHPYSTATRLLKGATEADGTHIRVTHSSPL